ncbi:MAG: hypothetical protein RRY18_01225 [Clostridia bacterium]
MNIALFYGGKSSEHDISIITESIVREFFQKEHTIYNIYIDKTGIFYLATSATPQEHLTAKFRKSLIRVTLLPSDNTLYSVVGGRLHKVAKLDASINCTHGVNGEDGSLAGLLQLSNVKEVESGICASSVCMDKAVSKVFFKGLGLPVVEGVVYNYYESKEELISKVENLGFPLIVKPCNCGSSIGVAFVKDTLQLMEKIDVALNFDNKLIIEKGLTNFIEVNCSALKINNEAHCSDLEKPMSSSEILSFADKYIASGKTKKRSFPYHCKYEEEIKVATKRIYQSLGCNGVIRVDFMVTPDGYFVNEANTIPGSFAYGLWSNRYTRSEYGNILLDCAFSASHLVTYDFNSNVLIGEPICKK